MTGNWIAAMAAPLCESSHNRGFFFAVCSYRPMIGHPGFAPYAPRPCGIDCRVPGAALALTTPDPGEGSMRPLPLPSADREASTRTSTPWRAVLNREAGRVAGRSRLLQRVEIRLIPGGGGSVRRSPLSPLRGPI